MTTTFEPGLETSLIITDGTAQGLTRYGMIRTNPFSAETQVRDLSDYSRRTVRLAFEEMPSTGDLLARYEAFLDATRLCVRPFWMKWPISRRVRLVAAGPLADGSRAAFPNPLPGASDLLVLRDEYPLNSANYTAHPCANLLTDNQAAATGGDVTEMSYEGSGGSVTYLFGDSKFGLGCWFYTNANTATGHAIKLASTARAAVTAGGLYKLVAWVKGNGSYRLEARWYNGAAANGSDTSMTPVTCYVTGWTLLEHNATAAPANTTHCELAIVRTSSSTGRFHADCLGVVPGQLDRWYLPSVAPGVIVFGTAPTAGERVYVSGTDYVRLRLRAERNATQWKVMETGHATADIFDCMEALE